jgi:acetyl esterase/lipase
VVYKKAPEANLEMTIDFPPDCKPTDLRPAIVFFFGGGWTNGTVMQFEEQASYLAKRGMVAARADYRVKSRHNVKPDRCVEDAKSAVRYLRQHARELGIDPKRIVAAGGSAGGHIAACTGLAEGFEADGEDHGVSSAPNALILFNPALSFVGVEKLLARIDHDEELARRISPTEHVRAETPPTLLLFGTKDPLLAQGKAFIRRSKEAGNRVELFTAEGQGHGFFNRQPWKEKTTQRMDDFLVSIDYLEE